MKEREHFKMDMDKAAIYQAYASSPQIYVLNEPSSNLDKRQSTAFTTSLQG